MRSKKKKLLFICFSALIMVGLCIGIFADNVGNDYGSVSNTPLYYTGESYVHFTYDNQSVTIPAGHYVLRIDYNNNYDVYHNILFINSDGVNDDFVKNIDNKLLVYYGVDDEYIEIDGYGTYYVSVYISGGVMSTTYYNTSYQDCYIYTVSDEYDIDIYDNSQDVWASVVSVVTDATDSIINNDLLLLFAAAVPIISFGVGFLIRLKFRG